MPALMNIDPRQQDLKSAMRTHRREIIDLLRRETPVRAALVMEEAGWPREWACHTIRQIEIEQNPANLAHGPVLNQKMRDRLQLQVACGAGLFSLCLLADIGFLFAGRIAIPPLVGLVAGLGMWLKAAPELKRYPDRRLPVYTPPKDQRGHNPGQY